MFGLLDRLLVLLDVHTHEMDWRTATAAARFTVLRAWPVMVEKLARAMLGAPQLLAVHAVTNDLSHRQKEMAVRLQDVIEAQQQAKPVEGAQAVLDAAAGRLAEGGTAMGTGK